MKPIRRRPVSRSGTIRGAFEIGIGPVYQRYTEPVKAYYLDR
jgi:hypothetical protein